MSARDEPREAGSHASALRALGRRNASEGVGDDLRPSGLPAQHPPVMAPRPRTREEVLRLWLALLVVCVIGGLFYYGLARLLVALGVF